MRRRIDPSFFGFTSEELYCKYDARAWDQLTFEEDGRVKVDMLLHEGHARRMLRFTYQLEGCLYC